MPTRIFGAGAFLRAAAACGILAAAGTLAACSGGGGSAAAPPPPGPVSVTPATLAFLGTGPNQAQSITASESNYSGPFVIGTGCANIAAIAQQPDSATAFSVTPSAAGSCTFTVTGASGQSQSVAITVTTTSVGGH